MRRKFRRLLHVLVDEVQGTWKRLGISLYDAQGNMRDISVVMAELDAALDGLPAEQQNDIMQTLAGSYGIVGLAALRSGMSMTDMQAKMRAQVGATSIANTMMGSFRNSMNNLRGSLEALMIRAFTPFMENILKPLAQQLTEVINRVGLWAEENPELTSLMVGFGVALLALGPALFVVGQVLSGIGLVLGALASPIALVVAGVAGLAVAFSTNFLGIRDLLEPILASIGSLLEASVLPLLERLVSFLAGMWQWVAPALSQLGAWFLQDVLPAIGDLLSQRILPLFESVFGFIARAWDIVAPALMQVAAWFLQDGLPAIQTFISTSLLPVVDGFFRFIGQVWEMVRPALEQFLAWFVTEGLPAIGTKLAEVWQTVFVPFIALLEDLWQLVEPALSALFNWFMTEGLPAIRTFLLGFWNEVLAPVVEVLAGIWDTVGAALGLLFEWFTVKGLPAIRDILKSFWDNVLTPVINVLKSIWEAVRPGVEAFASGIRQFLQPVMDFIHGIKNAISDLKRLLNQEIVSDARVQSMGYGDPRTGGTLMGFGGGGAFGGGKASGGSVDALRPYLVGEQGPEVIIPRGSGQVVPNHQLGAGVQIDNLTIHANSASEGAEAARSFRQELSHLLRFGG